MKKGINRLKKRIDKHWVYEAGIPTFERNFTRDAIISALLMQNPEMLKNQLIFCALKQGKKRDSYTGEEPGKIFHEYPAVIKRGLSPEFNACDTTALFLIGHEVYQKWTKDHDFAKEYKDNIVKALAYVRDHIKKGAFVDSPKFYNATRGALNVTYWKDSEMVDREKGIPAHPVAYFLAHVQNLRALKSAHFLLKETSITKNIAKMKKYLNNNLFNQKEKKFYLAIDKKGAISADSSDFLHALFYLSEDDISEDAVDAILRDAGVLETEYGYRSLSEKDSYRVSDPYHAMTLWPFDQAIINIGAKKFGLKKAEEISSRIAKHLDTAPELFDILSRKGGKKFRKGGCDPQLWTIAAKDYFRKQKSYRIVV